MGTVVSFLVDPGPLDDHQVAGAIDNACRELHDLDDQFSLWKPESELSRWRGGLVATPSALMDEVIELCAGAYDITHGLFDAWGLPGGFDPTGLVKGWAAERALAHLARAGVGGALVNAGGDICVLPGRSYDVGIRHPFEPDAMCGIVSVTGAVATSGVYERGAHIVNPFGTEVAAVAATVVGDSLVLCDVLATALVVGGAEVLYLIEGLTGVEGFFVDQDGSMYASQSMVFARH
ncbi:MAG: FAD:protein FMN transferase [Acidimicrobiales bacterium]